MQIKYGVGDRVLVEGVVKSVKIDNTGILYTVDISGRTSNLREGRLYPIVFGEAENGEGNPDDKG